MGRSKADVRCKKHPKHRQSPGVCAICLSERLSRLSNANSRSITTTMAASCSSSSSLSSCSSHYSSSGSSYSSPTHRYSEAKGSISFLIIISKNVLTKSRSMAFLPRMRAGETAEAKKKGGFWSKLLHPRSKRPTDEALVHSRTVRERVIPNRVH